MLYIIATGIQLQMKLQEGEIVDLEPSKQVEECLNRINSVLRDEDREWTLMVDRRKLEIKLDRHDEQQEHAVHTFGDWQQEVRDFGTRLGYLDWVLHQLAGEDASGD